MKIIYILKKKLVLVSKVFLTKKFQECGSHDVPKNLFLSTMIRNIKIQNIIDIIIVSNSIKHG
jgi:hypothetical protein